MISLISDFDGTLFFINEQPPVREIDVKKIQEFQRDNVFGLCTGRPLIGISDLKKFGIQCDFYILTSGALIVDKDFNIIYEKCMTQDVVQALIDETKQYKAVIQAKSKIYPIKEAINLPIEQKVIYRASDLTESALGMSVRTDNDEEAFELVKKLRANYKIQALQNENYVDIVPLGCSKGTAVQYIKEHYNLSFVAAIGDSYNDMDMLEKADISFTFATSPKPVQKSATHLVSGISHAIEIITNQSK